MRRRDLLRAFAALAAARLPFSGVFTAEPPLPFSLLGKPRPFDYAWLKGVSQGASHRRLGASGGHIREAVKALNWDQYQAIRYRADLALWAGDRRRLRVRIFHLGLYFQSPVRMYGVMEGRAQEPAYDLAIFD
jgi:periplasmic glucans biosynthesis protein